MTDNQITVGVLGTGRMGRVHLAAWARVRDEGLSLAGDSYLINLALYGRDPAKVAALAQEFDIARTTTTLDELTSAPAVDVVDNTLINVLHRGPLLEAIGHGKHVFCEKPLARTLAEAKEMWHAVQAAGVRHGIVQNMRFAPGPARAKEILSSGQLGRIFHAQVTFGYYVPQVVTNRPAWFYQREAAGGGIALDMLAHFLDLLPWMMGPVSGVYCQTGIFLPQREDGAGRRFAVEVEDTVAATLRFASGALADIFCSWVRRRGPDETISPRFQIDGQRGSLLFGPDRLWIGSGESEWQETALTPVDPWAVQFREFLSAVVTDRPYHPDWGDGVATMLLVDAAYRAVTERAEIPA